VASTPSDEAIVELAAEMTGVKAMTLYLASVVTFLMHERMTADEFVERMRRSVTTSLLADKFADGYPALEVVRVRAVGEVERMCSEILQGLAIAEHEHNAAQAAAQGEQES
jgi:undecaprenyl pyrophosphate synthase